MSHHFYDITIEHWFKRIRYTYTHVNPL